MRRYCAGRALIGRAEECTVNYPKTLLIWRRVQASHYISPSQLSLATCVYGKSVADLSAPWLDCDCARVDPLSVVDVKPELAVRNWSPLSVGLKNVGHF